MSNSSFQINQPPGTPYGTWDRARRDLALGTVECEAQFKSETSYKWEMFSAPAGVLVVINNSTTHTCNFNIATRGGYLVKLTVNDGLLSETNTVRYVGVPLENTGLNIPVANETNQDNSQGPSYDGANGWADKLEGFYRKVDEQAIVENLATAGGAGTVPTSNGSGALTMQAPTVGAHDIDGVSHNALGGASENNFLSSNASGKPKDSGSKASDFAPASHGISSGSHTGIAGTLGNFMGINASGLPVDSGSKAVDFAAATHGLNSAAHSGIAGTYGNFMALDGSGKPVDSTTKPSDFQAVSEKNAANGYPGLDGSSRLTGSQQVYGSIADTACVGNDSRLSDARAPTAHDINGAAHNALGGFTQDNFWSSDASGKAKDSGKKASDFMQHGQQITLAYIVQSAEPALAADGNMAVWEDSDDGKVYIVVRKASGNQKLVELG